mmetsp:Transcript_76321/g.205104  ORF Transcript_76321/g.205104 Transcript_76321/m.205104 type:complete len:446 (-) Transcript_76321:1372-2709(-)
MSSHNISTCKEGLRDMIMELMAVRSNLELFISAFRPGEDSQVVQTRFVNRVQGGLERLLALGASIQNSLPQVIVEILERGDRPSAIVGESSVQPYLDVSHLADSCDPCVSDILSRSKRQIVVTNERRQRLICASSIFNAAFEERFPTIERPIKRFRIMELLSSYADAVIPPDTTMPVIAPASGRLERILKHGATIQKGSPVANFVVGDKTIPLSAPVTGMVGRALVREGTSVEAGQTIVQLTVSTGVSAYLAALRRVNPVINAALERTRPKDQSHRDALPGRFVLALGVNGVLTARLALACLNRWPDGASPGSESVGAREEGAGRTGVRVVGVSVSGVTEQVDPAGASAHAVFRAVAQEAQATLHVLRSSAAASQGGDVVTGLVSWLASYRSLFSAKCLHCGRVLAEHVDPATGHACFMPPTGRTLVGGLPYHPGCRPLAAPVPA